MNHGTARGQTQPRTYDFILEKPTFRTCKKWTKIQAPCGNTQLPGRHRSPRLGDVFPIFCRLCDFDPIQKIPTSANPPAKHGNSGRELIPPKKKKAAILVEDGTRAQLQAGVSPYL